MVQGIFCSSRRRERDDFGGEVNFGIPTGMLDNLFKLVNNSCADADADAE